MSDDNSIGIWISDELPDGLREHNGLIEFQCRVCGRWTRWEGEVLDYDPDASENVCGGSPRCCP